jgi:hypothetical protein
MITNVWDEVVGIDVASDLLIIEDDEEKILIPITHELALRLIDAAHAILEALDAGHPEAV